MKVLHLLAAGGAGGIESLNKDYAKYSKLDNIFVFIWYGGCTTDEMKLSGRKVIEFNASKKNIFGPIKRIYNICKKENVNTIMVHHASPVMHVYAMTIKKFLPQIKVIVYAHGNAVDMCRINIKKGLWLRKLIMNKALHRADKIIAISKSVKQSLISFFNLEEEKIVVIYNGVDISRFHAYKSKTNKEVELIYVGRLIKQKGVQNTIKALSSFPKEIKYRFRIVGDGVYRKELEDLVKKYNLEDRVKFLGTRRDVAELLEQSDIFIHMPDWEEGFGITIVEAMAAGLICVCADSGAIPEIISNESNGFIVARDNENNLFHVLLNLIKNIDNLEDVRLKAIERAKEFSSEEFAGNLDSEVKKLIISKEFYKLKNITNKGR